MAGLPHRRQHLVAGPEDAQECIRMSVALLGFFGVCVALTGILSSLVRFSLPSYSTIISVPGSPVAFSVLILINSVVLLTAVLWGRNVTAAITLGIGGLWSMMLCVGFAVAFFHDERVSGLAPLICLLIAIFHLQKAWLLWSSRKLTLLYVPIALIEDEIISREVLMPGEIIAAVEEQEEQDDN
jgi:hypothetical protein